MLLLEVMLSDGDGFDVLVQMRRHQALGADGYITKPYTKNVLVDVIERVLKRPAE